MDGYLNIDEFSNALDYLKRVGPFLRQTHDPFRWKWATILMHSALYGFGVCALRGGNYEATIDYGKMPRKYKEKLRAIPKDSTDESYMAERAVKEEYLRNREPFLISLQDVLKRLQSEDWMPYCDPVSRPISLSPDESASIKNLSKLFRNKFLHFRPMSWYIEEQYFLPILKDVANVVGRILDSHSQIANKRGMRGKAISYVDEVKTLLDINKRLLEPNSDNAAK
ncbi:MAG: hypothetical protein KAT79_04710 [candidate division Zixibacteria bacterium]|nr:hypothetical protein [candidate division Zixibacteria bacterium]